MASVGVASAVSGRPGRLAAGTGRIAGALADLVATLLEPADDALAEIERFLRALAAESEQSIRRQAGAPEPLDRLATWLRLAPVEVDLLLVAGLAEEHEGCASAFRRLNPYGAPYPTVGLAARLLCTGREERAELRAVLERGTAIRSGVLDV